jgi:crotonobetainyl-CoA:carnitine CoA-transferase CaiB-like acyl-CoA transferase
MMLADLGADVIKVERPGRGDDTRHWGPPWVGEGDDRESAYYLCANRNKRSVEADLYSEEGVRLVRRLARDADVLVENYAPGTLEKWGIGFETLAEENPRLILCSITGYGSTGPGAGLPGYDFAVQGRAGWMAVTGEPEGAPMKVGVAVVDVLTGQNAAIGILAALHERERSGLGQRLEVTLIDSALAGLANVTQAALAGFHVPRYGNAHPTIVPYQAFETKDRMIVVTIGNDEQWRRFCQAAELRDLATDERFATNPGRVENREVLLPLLIGHLKERPADEWLRRLAAVGVPSAPVERVEDAVRDPAFRERNGVWTMDSSRYGSVDTVGSPFRLERTPPTLRRSAPALGEHNAEIERSGWD